MHLVSKGSRHSERKEGTVFLCFNGQQGGGTSRKKRGNEGGIAILRRPSEGKEKGKKKKTLDSPTFSPPGKKRKKKRWQTTRERKKKRRGGKEEMSWSLSHVQEKKGKGEGFPSFAKVGEERGEEGLVSRKEHCGVRNLFHPIIPLYLEGGERRRIPLIPNLI